MMRDTPKLAYNEGRAKDAKRMLLEEHAKKDLVRLVHLDGHVVEGGGDDVMHPDKDGHCLMGGLEAVELRNHAGKYYMPVRVELYEDAEKGEVVVLLRKIADWVERDWDNSLSRAGQERAHKEMMKMLEGDGAGEAPDNLIPFPCG
jgi:hypothetical protein